MYQDGKSKINFGQDLNTYLPCIAAARLHIFLSFAGGLSLHRSLTSLVFHRLCMQTNPFFWLQSSSYQPPESQLFTDIATHSSTLPAPSKYNLMLDGIDCEIELDWLLSSRSIILLILSILP